MSVARRTVQVVAFICTLIVGAASMAVIVTQTTWFKEWLRGFIVRQADDYVNGRLSIGRLDGNLFFGVALSDVGITQEGEEVIDIDEVGLDYNVLTWLREGVVLDDIRLTRPVFRLQRDADGWNLTRLIRARTPDQPLRGRRPIIIGEIGVSDGTLYIADAVGTSGIETPARIERLDASVGVRSDENELMVDIGHVSLRAADPSIGINELSGVIRRVRDEVVLENVSIRTEESSLDVRGTIREFESGTPILDLEASSDKLALDELARVVPALRGYELQPAFEVRARGPLERLAVDFSAREKDVGQAGGNLMVDAAAPARRVTGTVEVEHLNVQALTRGGTRARPSQLHSDITGRARVDVTLPGGLTEVRGTYEVDADHVRIAGYEARNVVGQGRIDGTTVRVNARANAYGGSATTAGVVQVRTPLALDLRGTARNVDLRNLPRHLELPRASTNLQFAYTVTGRGSRFSGDVTLDRSTVAGASIAPGAAGTFAIGGGAAPEYAAKGEVSGLDVQRIGREFEIEAIATDRYSSQISGTFDVRGSGGGRHPLTLEATGTLVDSTLFGATFPAMDVAAQLAGGDAHVRTVGRFEGLNPATILDNERSEGTLTGTVNAETTIRGYAEGVTVDSIDVAGRVELDRSRIGDVAVESAVVDGRYANREGELAELAVTGPDITVTGQGTIALNDTGSSNLTLHVESPSLDEIGELVGQPLKGAVILDATITGNARQLHAEGTLQGSNLGHGANEALTVDSTFAATVPDLTIEAARIDADTTATFVEIGGQRINELTAETSYADSRLEFTAVAQQGARELAAGGSLVLHPDHQEVHLGDLSLRTEGIEWRTAPGTDGAIRYGGGRIEVEDVQLVSGDQRIHAEGVIGSPGETLQVRAENVDVAEIDALLLGEQRLAGRFTGTAVISGTTDAPRVSSEFTLSDGAFRRFTFEMLAGTVDYSPDGIEMDVRLQQSPAAWLTAKGHAPVTLFQPNPPGVDPHDLEGLGGGIDIEIASSEIDLGLVQGFTTYVTDVTGTMQANVRVTGTGYDPHFEGVVAIRGGAFAVPDLGTSYTGLDTRIDLRPDVLSIEEFKILDNRGFPMTIGGTLAVHERAVGAVNIRIQSENFEVVDNRLADLKLDTELRVTGDLRRPRIEGFVEVENGTIHLAEVIERATRDAYATQPALLDLEGADAAARASAEAPDVREPAREPTLLDGIELDLALGIPSNLVLRGRDIRPANAPIDIGDLNVTVGGAVQVRKARGGDLRLVGEVNTVRGTYNFQGRRFDILREGRIRFAGTGEINPIVDIRASRVISGVETFVRVRGTMRQPELSFSSNPPLDQADILSLIVFNQPINQLGTGQQISLAERAGALAGGYLASGLTRSIGGALELDEFEIQTGDEGGFGPSLTVGEQVGERFFFRIRQGFGDAQATELILEYQITDFLRVQGTAAETTGGTQRVTFRRIERAGLDLFFYFSY